MYKTKTVVSVSPWLQLICSEIMCRRSWKFTEEAGLFLRRRILLDFCLSPFIIIRNVLRAVIIIFFLSIWSSHKYQYDRCLWWQLPQNVFLLNTANLKDPSSGNWQVGSYINFKQQLKPVSFFFFYCLTKDARNIIQESMYPSQNPESSFPELVKKVKAFCCYRWYEWCSENKLCSVPQNVGHSSHKLTNSWHQAGTTGMRLSSANKKHKLRWQMPFMDQDPLWQPPLRAGPTRQRECCWWLHVLELQSIQQATRYTPVNVSPGWQRSDRIFSLDKMMSSQDIKEDGR